MTGRRKQISPPILIFQVTDLIRSAAALLNTRKTDKYWAGVKLHTTKKVAKPFADYRYSLRNKCRKSWTYVLNRIRISRTYTIDVCVRARARLCEREWGGMEKGNNFKHTQLPVAKTEISKRKTRSQVNRFSTSVGQELFHARIGVQQVGTWPVLSNKEFKLFLMQIYLLRVC